MAAVGPVAMDEALKKGGSDLRFTLSRNDVSGQLQAAFFNNGITTVQQFSSFFRSETDLIDVLSTKMQHRAWRQGRKLHQ